VVSHFLVKAKKVVLVGEMSVGKTCIVDCFCRGSIDPEAASTLGATSNTQRIKCDGQDVPLLIWDTAGQEQFRTLTPMYYRGARAVIIVYSIASDVSFRKVDFWVDSVRNHLHESAQIVIVGNKNDLADERQVEFMEGQQMADRHGAMFFETSAVTGAQISELFGSLARAIIADEAMNQAEESALVTKTEKGCC
jgi:small GTP-binding protein